MQKLFHDRLREGGVEYLEIHKAELVRRVRAHIAAGRFRDADEVLERALDALEESVTDPLRGQVVGSEDRRNGGDPGAALQASPYREAGSGTESLRLEFEALAKVWRRDTQHLSQISQKITHPAFLRIIGMGEAVVPLLLRGLRDQPAHWFTALSAITNADPVPAGANPIAAREAWLDWGRKERLID